MADLLISILFPLVLSCSLIWPIWRYLLPDQLGKLERLVLGCSLSVSLYIVSLSWYSTYAVPHLDIFVKAIFLLGLFSTFVGIYKIYKSIHWKVPVLAKAEKIAIFLGIALIVKIVILYSTHPIIDPDVLTAYLPYARSIAIQNKAPQKDLYTADPMTIPPIGGPVLFAANYLVSGSIFDENFRLLTLPFLLNLAILTYLYARKVSSRLYSIVATIVFLSFPLIDGILVNWTLYPDIIYASLGLTVFYFTEHYYFQISSTSKRLIFSIMIGVLLAATLLLKSQGLLILYVFGLIILHKISVKNFKLYPLAIISIIAPFILSKYGISGISSFGYVTLSPLMLIFYIFVALVISFIYIRRGQAVRVSRAYTLIAAGFVSALGLIWFKRNLNLYSNVSVPLTIDYGNFYNIQREYKVDVASIRSSFESITIFTNPLFGSAYLIPKIIGLALAFYNHAILLPFLWSFYIYVITITFFGSANNRYLLPILPILAIIISLGMSKLATVLSKYVNHKISYIVIILTICFSIFSLMQSEFIYWNFGPSFSYSRKTDYRVNKTIESQDSLLALQQSSKYILYSRLNSNLKSVLQGFQKILTFTTGHIQNISPERNVINMIIYGFISSIISIGIIFFLKNGHSALVIGITIALIFILPYAFIISRISNNKPWSFADKEKKLLYENYGEVGYVSPYLKSHAREKSVVLIFGPLTGTAYQTGIPTWNVEYGYGLKELIPILQSSDSEVIQYMSDHSINYAVFSRNSLSNSRTDRLRDSTSLIRIIENPKYFTQINSTDSNNSWEIFERNIN